MGIKPHTGPCCSDAKFPSALNVQTKWLAHLVNESVKLVQNRAES